MNLATNKTKRRSSLRDLRTAVSSRIRSKPTIEGQRFLDLYVLQRDRFRWLRLKVQAQRSIESIDAVLTKLGFTPEGDSEVPAEAAAIVAPPSGRSRTIEFVTTKKRKQSA